MLVRSTLLFIELGEYIEDSLSVISIPSNSISAIAIKVITNNSTNICTNRHIKVGLGTKLVPDTVKKTVLDSPNGIGYKIVYKFEVSRRLDDAATACTGGLR